VIHVTTCDCRWLSRSRFFISD